MSYEGDSLLEAWEYWFDQPPSEGVRLCLEHRCTKHSLAAVLEAIEITGSRFPLIEEDECRLQYLSGILRRKALERVAPARAEEERKIDVMIKYLGSRHADWQLEREHVRQWLQFLDFESVRVLATAASDWQDFRELVEDAVQRARQEQAQTHTATVLDIRNLGTK